MTRWRWCSGVALGLLTSNALAQVRSEEPTEVIIAAPMPPPNGARTVLLAREAAQTAGSQGDAAKVVQSLPGVARAGGQAEPVVWGSSPQETGIFLDRVPLPLLFHGSGLRSIVPTSLLSTVRLTPGAYGVELGRYTGGVLELTTLEGVPLKPNFSATVDALDASAALASPFTASTGARLGARYGYVQRWLPDVLGKRVAQLYTVPSYWDAHVTAHVDLPNSDQAKVVLITSHDNATRVNSWARYETERATTRVYATYEHATYAADGSTTRTRVIPFIGYDRDVATTWSYATPSETCNEVRSTGLRVDTTHTWGPIRLGPVRVNSLQINAGVDARTDTTLATHRGSLTVPPREGDVQVFGLPPGRDYVADEVVVTRAAVAPYAELDLVWAPFRFTPGLRFETALTELERGFPSVTGLPDAGATRYTSNWLPRLAIELAAARRVHWFAAVSRHTQGPQPLDLGTLIGNPNSSPAEATHLVVGDTTQLTEALSVQILAFRKWLSHLALRSTEAHPAPGRVLSDTGRGDVWGSQIFVQLRTVAGWSGWLGVTISQSRRRNDAELWRPFDYDQPLSSTLVLNKALGSWSFGTRLRASSGFPRPSIMNTYYDLQLGRYVPVAATTPGWRLPAFFSLDLRAERRMLVRRGGSLYLYAELQNATNHANIEEVVYTSDYTERTFMRGLPVLAFLGMRTEL